MFKIKIDPKMKDFALEVAGLGSLVLVGLLLFLLFILNNFGIIKFWFQ